MSEDVSREELLALYRDTKTIAVLGASGTAGKPAHDIPSYLRRQGYRIIPVNPRGGEILGEQAYPSLGEVDIPVDLVDVFRPPQEAVEVARDAVAAGTRVLWFQPGTHTDEAVRLATAAGLTVVTGLCLGSTHRELGLGR